MRSYSANGTYMVAFKTTPNNLKGLYSGAYDTVIQFCSYSPTIFQRHLDL